ncbi:hypothetical protein MMC18_006020 [Xylographa bjoerkii]|nr:hypothetical protein [Xylographa bjoerkii]
MAEGSSSRPKHRMFERLFQSRQKDPASVLGNQQPIQPADEGAVQESAQDPKGAVAVSQKANDPRTLWQRAYQEVADENRHLVDTYEEIVRTKVVEIDGHNLLGKQEQARVIIENCQRKIKSRQWTVTLGSKQIHVRAQLQRIAKFVQQFSGAIGTVAALDPVYASPAWTGISLLLPFFVNSLGQDDKLRDGLERISQLVVIYSAVQKQLIGPNAVKNVEFEKSLAGLYSKILYFQIKAACHLCHKIPMRLLSDSMVTNDWTGMIAEIDRRDAGCKAFQDVMSTGLLLVKIQELTEKFETWSNLQNENIKILRWISEDNPAIDHNNVRTKLGSRYFDTGKWLLNPEKGHENHYRRWKRTIKGCLWLKGSVGTGKSCLTSIVIEDLAESQDNDIVAFYYASRSQQTTSGTAILVILQSLLSQLACSSNGIDMSESVKARYEAAIVHGSRNPKITIEDCIALIPQVLLEYNTSFIIVDAVDECEKPTELLRCLRDILARSQNVRLFLSSRMDVRVKEMLPSVIEVCSDTIDTSKDINNYIVKELHRGERRNPDVISSAMAENMIRTLDSLSQGMFRWVELQLELLISEEYPILVPQEFDDRLAELEKHSGSLDQLSRAYNEIWERNLRNQGKHARRIVTKALRWISCCIHHFGPLMLHTAVMIDEDSSLARSITPSVILRLCSNFLIEERGGTVQFAHLSVREFLEEKRIDGILQFSIAESNAQVTETCLNFWASYNISLQQLAWAIGNDKALGRFLIECKNSTEHISEESEDTGHDREREIPGKLDNANDNELENDEAGDKQSEVYENSVYDKEESWFCDPNFVIANAKYAKSLQLGHEMPLNLYNVWVFGCYACNFWLEHSVTAKNIRKDYSTTLHTCFRHFFGPSGGFDVYQRWADDMMLATWLYGDEHLSVFIYSEDGRPVPSRFLTICRYGFDELLPNVMREEWLSDTNLTSQMNGLHLAASNGHLEILKFLLHFGADVNSRNKFDSTALHFAAEQGDVEAVRLLGSLDGTGLMDSNKAQFTPLPTTVGLRHPVININARNWRNQTPLGLAAGLGHAEVVRQLLNAKGIDVNALDGHNRTVLHIAASQGHIAVVDLLLDVDGVDVNSRDQSGQSPLHMAVEYKKVDMVDRLLKKSGIDVNAIDNDGRTPLLIAAKEGNLEIVNRLIQTSDVDLLATDNDGRALLDYAAIQGYGGIVRRLLGLAGMDILTRPIRGRTLLHSVAYSGDVEVIPQLLETGRFDVNAADDDGNTPLHLAAIGGSRSVEVVKVLAAAENININARGRFGRTALHWAVAKRDLKLVRLLLRLADIDVNAKDMSDNTPLHEAATSGIGKTTKIVEVLLKAKGIDPNARNNIGRTAAEVAVAGMNRAEILGDTVKEQRCLDVLNLLLV